MSSDVDTPEVMQKHEAEAGNGGVPATTEGPRFDLARVDDPTAAIDKAEQLVGKMAEKCTGPDYIATIQGKEYPKVDWWTTVGASLGLFPREEKIHRLDRDDEVAYEATVGVYRGQDLVTRASAICSDAEPTWSGRDEYAIRSMALTRATGKAFRLGLSFLPVMAGMEPTPAEEMPQQAGTSSGNSGPNLLCPECDSGLWDNRNDPEKEEWPDLKCKADDCDWKAWDAVGTADETLSDIGTALNELSGWSEAKADTESEWLSAHKPVLKVCQVAADSALERIEDAVEQAKDAVAESTQEG